MVCIVSDYSLKNVAMGKLLPDVIPKTLNVRKIMLFRMTYYHRMAFWSSVGLVNNNNKIRKPVVLLKVLIYCDKKGFQK